MTELDQKIEALAIRAALGNNGGTWAEHYTEAQKEHWRAFVRDLARDAVPLRVDLIQAAISAELDARLAANFDQIVKSEPDKGMVHMTFTVPPQLSRFDVAGVVKDPPWEIPVEE